MGRLQWLHVGDSTYNLVLVARDMGLAQLHLPEMRIRQCHAINTLECNRSSCILIVDLPIY